MPLVTKKNQHSKNKQAGMGGSLSATTLLLLGLGGLVLRKKG
jgi:hypothetical protein